MSTSSCIRHPERNRYIQLYAWQVSFCQNNHCAALILSYFIAWHDWKLLNDQYYRRANDIAEMHSDGRPHNENAYLFFTTEQLIEGCMGLYGKKTVCEGLDFLVELGVISVHKNPNPRYHFDKTKYFQFYPKICNRWIADTYPVGGDFNEKLMQDVDSYDNAKMDDRKGKTALPSSENSRPSGKISQAITDTTNNTTNKKQSINSPDDFKNGKGESILIETIVEALIEKGMPRARFYPDAIQTIEQLHAAGTTLNQFLCGYDVAVKCTNGNGFGVNYLVKVVDSLVAKVKKVSDAEPEEKVNYRSDYKNAEKWAGDLL